MSDIPSRSASSRFIEELGLISQEHGDARIAGRMLGLLVTEGRPLSLGQISERLSVSRASVSTNARQLARRGVLRLTARAGDRQDYYEIAELPYSHMLGEMARRFERHARDLAVCVDGMRQEDPAAAVRAEGVLEFFERSASVLNDWAVTFEPATAPAEDET